MSGQAQRNQAKDEEENKYYLAKPLPSINKIPFLTYWIAALPTPTTWPLGRGFQSTTMPPNAALALSSAERLGEGSRTPRLARHKSEDDNREGIREHQQQLMGDMSARCLDEQL